MGLADIAQNLASVANQFQNFVGSGVNAGNSSNATMPLYRQQHAQSRQILDAVSQQVHGAKGLSDAMRHYDDALEQLGRLPHEPSGSHMDAMAQLAGGTADHVTNVKNYYADAIKAANGVVANRTAALGYHTAVAKQGMTIAASDMAMGTGLLRQAAHMRRDVLVNGGARMAMLPSNAQGFRALMPSSGIH